MRHFIFAGLATLSLFATAPGSHAQQVLTDAQLAANRQLTEAAGAALDAGDYPHLDQILAEAHRNAVASRDFKPLRATYQTLFVTASRDRLTRSEAWQKALPGSAYAATALAWEHYHRAFEFRGEAYGRYVSQEAWSQYHGELEQAQNLAQAATAQGDDFLPAIDLLLRLRRVGANELPVAALVGRALDVAPGRYALLEGVEALDPRWGGDLAAIEALCAGAAPKIGGYSTELCMAEAAFTLNARGPLRSAALEVLDRHDEDFLDYARLDAYLREWSGRPEAAREAMRIVRAQDDPSEHTLNVIATRFGERDFYREMLPKVEAAQRARLQDAPEDTATLLVLSQDILQRAAAGDRTAAPAEAFALWRKTLDLGAYRADVWLLGSQIDAGVNDPWDYDRRKAFFENAISYGNQQPMALNAYLAFLGQMHEIATDPIYALPEGTAFDRDKVGAATACEMVRATRLLYEACSADSSDAGCRTYGTVEVAIAAARELMTQAGCERERTAALEDLAYSPVPGAQFVPGLGSP